MFNRKRNSYQVDYLATGTDLNGNDIDLEPATPCVIDTNYEASGEKLAKAIARNIEAEDGVRVDGVQIRSIHKRW